MDILSLLKKKLLIILLLSANYTFCQYDKQDLINNNNKIKDSVDNNFFVVKVLLKDRDFDLMKSTYNTFIEKKLGNILLLNERRFKESEFQSQVDIITGIGPYKRAITGIRFVNGYKFDGKHFFGLGFGGTKHHGTFKTDLKYDNHNSYPIFIRYSYDRWVEKSTPYVFSDIGSQFEDPNKVKMISPLFFRVGIGNKLILKQNIFYFSLNYSCSNSRYSFQYWEPSKGGYVTTGYSNWYKAHTAEINIGFQFN